MSVKKLLISTALGVATLGATAANAGGPDMMAAPAPVESYFYVEGSVGYAFQDYTNEYINDSQFPGGAATLHGDGASGGITYGADLGYMFNQYIGAELGWTHLPSFTGILPNTVTASTVSLSSSGAAWLVAKLVAPLTASFDAFFKAGVSYKYGNLIWQSTLNTPFTPSVTKMREWRPVLGAGLTYNFAEQWMASLSWMHFMGGTSYQTAANNVRYIGLVTPASDVLSLSVGYKFTV